MGEIRYPTNLGSILDKPAFLIAVDRIVDLVIENTPDDETRLAELMLQLTALCLDQAKLVVGSAYHPTDHETTITDRMYYIICAADSRWDIVRKYIKDTRNLDAHPLGMISLLRGATVRDVEHQVTLDHIILDALDRYVDSMEEEIRNVMGWTEDDTAHEVKLPSFKNDPDLLMQFFEAFKNLGTVHRKRSDYETDEQRQAYDKLMAIFKTITE